MDVVVAAAVSSLLVSFSSFLDRCHQVLMNQKLYHGSKTVLGGNMLELLAG